MVLGLERQLVLSKTGPRRNTAGYLTGRAQLLFRSLGEQRNEKIFERDDADAQLNHFGVAQRQGRALAGIRSRTLVSAET